MKHVLLSTLRDKTTSREAYRIATQQLSALLAFEVASILEKQEHVIETPLAKTKGTKIKPQVTLIPILRSGLALLPSFLQTFPQARVGFFGVRRDETTALPHVYYQNIPDLSPHDVVIILEPMIATGGSVDAVIDILRNQRHFDEEKLIICSFVGATPGMSRLKALSPKAQFLVVEEDKSLNSHFFIVPGLGDFGDRYFGTDANPELTYTATD